MGRFRVEVRADVEHVWHLLDERRSEMARALEAVLGG
jgi:hypothetical protein